MNPSENNWQKYIVSDPFVLTGKPAIKGTRLSVEFLLSLLENGWTESQLLESYPQLESAHLRAVFSYARESVIQDQWLTLAH